MIGNIKQLLTVTVSLLIHQIEPMWRKHLENDQGKDI